MKRSLLVVGSIAMVRLSKSIFVVRPSSVSQVSDPLSLMSLMKRSKAVGSAWLCRQIPIESSINRLKKGRFLVYLARRCCLPGKPAYRLA